MVMSIVLAKMLIKEAEGFRATEYLCPAGYPSIGYGRNLKFYPLTDADKAVMVKNKLGDLSVSQNIADDWLTKAVETIYEKIKNADYFVGIGDARQAVVIDMIYNLGYTEFQGFKKFIEALKNKDFEKASFEIEHGSAPNGKSHYYNQVKSRALRNIEIMKSGELKK